MMSKDVKQIIIGLIILFMGNVAFQLTAMWRNNAVFEYRLSELEQAVESIDIRVLNESIWNLQRQIELNRKDLDLRSPRIERLEGFHQDRVTGRGLTP